MKEKSYQRKKKSICKQDFQHAVFVRNLSFLCGLGRGVLNIAKNILVLILPSSYPKQVPNIITEKCYSDICGTCYYYNFVKKNSEGTT